MKKNQSSITAQGIAFARALESSRPAGERVCYDPLARQMLSPAFYLFCKLFVGYGEKRAPGVMGYLAARTRYIDDYVQSCIADGIEQLVILGAGLDSRAYRFEPLKERVRVFEVDHPATQQGKIEKVKKVLKDLPEHVTYIPIDFNTETLGKLFGFGYNSRLKTLFIWEGVTYYLAADAVDSTLEFVRKNSGQGSSIIFDYVYTSALTTARKQGEVARMQRYSRFTGEGLVFGIEEGRVEEFLSRRGYTQIKNATSEDFKRAYFAGANQNRPVAPIYAIVHAAVGPSGDFPSSAPRA
jgi:methyltransferase (TIGR00027 family)